MTGYLTELLHPKECSSLLRLTLRQTVFILKELKCVICLAYSSLQKQDFLKRQSVISQIGRSLKREIICPFTYNMSWTCLLLIYMYIK